MSTEVSSTRFDWFSGRKGLAVAILVGIIIRMVVAPFLTYDFDIYHWGVILENLQTGNGLYGLDGYYYTPVWGYIMGFESLIMGFFNDLGAYGFRYEELLPVETFDYRFHTATVTTVAFDLAMKIPLFVADAVTACLIYMLIKDYGGDDREACIGAAIWMLAPLIIYMSGIQAMFDSISAMFMILLILLLKRGYRFLSGSIFTVAVLLKFFPAFAVFVLLLYIIYKGRETDTVRRDVILTIVGAAVALIVLYIPQIMDGTFIDSLSFMLARADDTEGSIISPIISINMVMCLIGFVYFTYRMRKDPRDDLDKTMLRNTIGALICAICLSTTPQYVIVVVPLLICYGVMYSKHIKNATFIIVIGGFFSALFCNTFPILSGAAVNQHIVDVQFIFDGLTFLESHSVFGVDLHNILILIGTWMEYIGVIFIILMLFGDLIRRYIPRLGNHIPEVES